MADLEQDLLQSQSKIIQILTQYEKNSEEIIKSNYNNQLQRLLQTIATFDHQKIRQFQIQIKDQTSVKYIQNIGEQIQKYSQTKNQKQAKDMPKVEEPTNRQQPKKDPKPTQTKNNQTKKGGIFSFIFGNKQKKATQMILPDQQPKCYYDQATKSWIFEGQEPVAPKTIPKPPSVSERKERQQAKKETKDDSQFNQLTAPPIFKRKSTVKGKAKIKEEVQIVKQIQQPLSFAKIVKQINSSFGKILEKSRQGFYEKHIEIQSNNDELLNEFINFAQKILKCNEEINHTQNKVIDKWSKILASESRQLKIMEKVIKQISSSADNHISILQKISNQTKTKNIEKIVVKQVLTQRLIDKTQQQSQTNFEMPQDKRQEMQEQKQMLNQQILKLQLQIDRLKSEKDQLQSQKIQNLSSIQTLKKQLQDIQRKYIGLLKDNQNLITQISEKQTKITQLTSESQKQLASLKSKYQSSSRQKQQLTLQIKHLQDLNKTLQQQKDSLSKELYQQKFKTITIVNKINGDLGIQRTKIQAQLQSYQQKYNHYIKGLHEEINQGCQRSQHNQNKLFLSIFEKRVSPTQSILQTSSLLNHQNNFSLLLLSDIIISVTQFHLDQLQKISLSYNKLNKKYQQSKELMNKIKNNSTSQSMTLNRCVAKLKSLLEMEKNGKKQAEERCSHLQLQCDKLIKKLQHYREEDQFNKSYLSKLKSSKINTQNENLLSLQEDKDQLTSQVDDLQREIQQKNQNLKKIQSDLQDLLINYQKSQSKLLQVQRRQKESHKEIRTNKHFKEEMDKKVKLLELKLLHQKERYDQIQNREQTRLKNAQSSFQKKLKLFKNQLEQSHDRQKQLKQQMEQVQKQVKLRLNSLQENHLNMESQLKKALRQKQSQNNQLLLLLKESQSKFDAQKQQKMVLTERNSQLTKRQTQLKDKLNETITQHIKQTTIHKDSQQNLNNIISNLIEKYTAFKEDQQQFKKQYDQRLIHLQSELLSAHHQSNQLINQIHQYSNHIHSLNSHIQDIKNQQEQQRKYNQFQLLEALQENKQLKLMINSLKIQIKQENKQIQEFQQIIQQASQSISRLTSNQQQISKDKIDLHQKLILKDRQIQTSSNEINKLSELLMVKTEELLEKDRLMLQRQQLSVTKKQEFDQLKNQFDKISKALSSSILLQKEVLELKATIQSKEKLISNLEESINVHQQSAKEKDNQIQQLFTKYQSAQASTKTLHIQNNSIKISLEQAKTQANISIQRNKIYQASICLLQSNLLEKQQWNWGLLEQIQMLKQNNKQIQEQLNNNNKFTEKYISQKDKELLTLQIKLNEKDTDLQSVQKQKKNVQSLLLEKQKLIKDLQTNIKNLNMSNNLLQQQKVQLQNSVQQFMNTVQLLRSDKQSLIKKIQNLQGLNKQFQTAFEKSEGLKQKLQIKISDLQEQIGLTAKQDVNDTERNDQQILLMNNKIGQKMSQIVLLQDQIKAHLTRIQLLQNQKAQITQIIQSQEAIIQKIDNKQLQRPQNNQITQLQQLLNTKNEQIIILNKKIHQFTNFNKDFSQINKLLQEIIQLKSLNKELNQNYKNLQDQNASLVNQKVQLLKSNNYLVTINQKLVAGGKNSQFTKQPQRPQSQILTPSKNQEVKNEAKGSFFGAISSLFLTPSQAQRLRK